MERWKDISGYEDSYEVSDWGNVRSKFRRVHSGGPNGRAVLPRILKPSKISGYPAVSLTQGDQSEKRYVHELVLTAFRGPRPKGMEARHFPDSNRENNHLDNLSWGTPLQNGGDRVGSYLTEESVEEICRLATKGLTQKEIAKRFRRTQGRISVILSGTR